MLTAQLSPPLHVSTPPPSLDQHDRARLVITPDASAHHPGGQISTGGGGQFLTGADNTDTCRFVTSDNRRCRAERLRPFF